eukprot:s22_g28.t1
MLLSCFVPAFAELGNLVRTVLALLQGSSCVLDDKTWASRPLSALLAYKEDVPKTLDSWEALLRAVEEPPYPLSWGAFAEALSGSDCHDWVRLRPWRAAVFKGLRGKDSKHLRAAICSRLYAVHRCVTRHQQKRSGQPILQLMLTEILEDLEFLGPAMEEVQQLCLAEPWAPVSPSSEASSEFQEGLWSFRALLYFRNALQGLALDIREPFRTSGKVEATRHLTRCSSYDIFVSHDWQTSRWLKYASLLVLLNSRAAALATLVVSLALGLLVACQVLPNYSWSVSIGYLTFAVFFFFWQHIQDIFLTPKLAFLDKLCIPQDDEEVKEKCILGLAGFLKHSRQLVILFSESYISRLWCVYEFTAFMSMHSNQGHVQTVPVVLPLLILLHAAWWFAVKMFIFLIWHASQTSHTMKVVLSIGGLAVTFLSTYPLQAWVGKRLTKNLQSLSRQLREFDIHESKCSCCSAGHETPSGERIPCDRDLIYQSLADWYGNDADDLQGRLESFSTAVRTQFADRILSTWEEQSMPIQLFIYTVFSMNTPFLIIRIPDIIVQAQQEPSAFLACVVALKVLVASWGYIWPAMLVYLWACKTMWTLTLQCSQWPIFIEAGLYKLSSWLGMELMEPGLPEQMVSAFREAAKDALVSAELPGITWEEIAPPVDAEDGCFKQIQHTWRDIYSEVLKKRALTVECSKDQED